MRAVPRKNYPVESMEINASVGEKILQAFPEIRVDVHNPDVMLYIEVREHIYIYSIEIPGSRRYAGRHQR